MRIYVASSWRNQVQPSVVQALRAAGHEVYDFKNPAPGDHGFHWAQVDPHYREWTPTTYLKGLEHPIAEAGFQKDMAALDGAQATVLVLPSGRSAHLEAGYAIGRGQPVIILVDETFEPELMYKMAYKCVTTIDGILDALEQLEIDAEDFDIHD
jgi:nucleoside 2-deoxyribosyltransferase